jgi:hypothetical protein
VFSGPKGMTDRSAAFHVDIYTLNDTALTIRRELKQALGRQHWSIKEVHRRAELSKTIKTMH